MKKYLAILLAVLLVLALVGCGEKTPTVEEDVPAAAPPSSEAPAPAPSESEAPASVAPPPVEESPVAPPPVEETTPEPPPPVAAVEYVSYAIQFKNKTGVAMSGLYLYPTGSADKGNSLCPDEWPDADEDKAASTILTYVVRPLDGTCDLYVEWVDGTNATLPNLTIINHDKFSMKDGKDPSTWEHEPMDDDGEIADADEVVAAGRTTDNFYGDYAVIPIEMKNKTGKDINEYYFYEEGVDPRTYNNMIDNALIFAEDGDGMVPVSKPWPTGKGGEYVFMFFVRPVSEYYEIHLVFTDGTTLTIPELDMFTPNADGFPANEVSMKSADDPYGSVPAYDDGDPEPLEYLADSLKSGPSADGWYPVFPVAP